MSAFAKFCLALTQSCAFTFLLSKSNYADNKENIPTAAEILFPKNQGKRYSDKLGDLPFLKTSAKTSANTDHLSLLATPPSWSFLNIYQNQISRRKFLRALQKIYTGDDRWQKFIKVQRDRVQIMRKSNDPNAAYFELYFKNWGDSRKKRPYRYWRAAEEMPAANQKGVLSGVRIALDPGHIGGAFARMEERWFQLTYNGGISPPVMEGNMTLRVAQLLANFLRTLGAEVFILRKNLQPVTSSRPENFVSEARRILAKRGNLRPRTQELKEFSELLFYRVGEIRARAELVNQKIKPDFVVALHFNAEAWGDPNNPDFVPQNHAHFLVNGCYSGGEIAYDDQRFFLLARILQNISAEEIPLTLEVARNFAKMTTIPPFRYKGSNTRAVSGSPYVWARNLLANRIYMCPVIYCEPYVMNSREDFLRVMAGEYVGKLNIAGKLRENIYVEYARALAVGIVEHYKNNRKR